MKTYIPLHDFVYYDQSQFVFGGNDFVLTCFSAFDETTGSFLLSESNIAEIQMADWALVAPGLDQDAIAQNANLLIMTFWLMSENVSPVIKFRLGPNAQDCAILHDVMQPNLVADPPLEEYRTQVLKDIDEVYQELKLANGQTASSRPHNAIYFLFLATHTTHWIGRFAFLMSALEAVFGNDYSRTKSKGQKGVTETIKTRVSHFVEDAAVCSPELVGELYNTRSRIAHGDIRANEDPSENLRTLKLLEDIVKRCFRKIVQKKVFYQFGDKLTRDAFLTSLD
jgi:hypothetical protein